MAERPNQHPDGATLRFFGLFRRHWVEGSGRDPQIMPEQKAWSVPLFHNVIHKVGYPVDDDTVRLWARGHESGKSLPSRDNFDGILKVFGLNGNQGEDLRQAWQNAQATRQSFSRGPSEAKSTEVWVRLKGGFATEALAEIQFHDLEPTNQAGRWRLHASPILGVREQDDAEIGLNDVSLVLATRFTVAQASMLGENLRKHDHIKRVAGGMHITGPRDHRGRLYGNPVGDEHLAIIEPGEPDADRVTLTLCASRRSVCVSLPIFENETTEETTIRAKKEKALEAVLCEDMKDKQGRFILAQSTRRKVLIDE